jgi:hypothetical protein
LFDLDSLEIRISKCFGLIITGETQFVRIRIWCIKISDSPGAMGLNLELRVKVFFSPDSGTLGVAFHHPGG